MIALPGHPQHRFLYISSRPSRLMKIYSVQASVDGILAKGAKDARTPRQWLIMCPHIFNSLGVLASLGAIGEKIVRPVP